MNRTVFSLSPHDSFRTGGGLEVTRSVAHFAGGAALDDLVDLLDRRRGVMLSSGTTVPGRYESFDLGFADPPLVLETAGAGFDIRALNPRGEVLVALMRRLPGMPGTDRSPRSRRHSTVAETEPGCPTVLAKSETSTDTVTLMQ